MANETVEVVETATKVPVVQAMTKVNGKSAEGKSADGRESRDVALTDIVVTPEFNFDPRRMNDEASIRGLARSIEATDGLLQPVLLGAVVENGKTSLHLVNGFRRVAAYKLLNKKSIPATIRYFDSLAALVANGAENTSREAPHPYHLAKRMQYLKETHYKGDKEADAKIAEAFGVSRKHVQNLLRAYRSLAPELRVVFEGPTASLAEESPPLKWLIEQAKESPEDQVKAYNLRYGEGAGGEDEDEDKPKNKKAKKDDDAAKTPRMRNRDKILFAKDKVLRKLSERQVTDGFAVQLSIRGFSEDKQKKLSDRERLICRALLGWVLDATADEVLDLIEPQEPDADE
jgi:ParB/RepB/Spo0J family partition protein